MPGRLVLCATPIGNLGDAPPRLADELAAADVVFAEDTRRAAKLLAHLGLEVAVRSFFVGNEVMRADELAERLARGERVALVTDAGTPAVADPGVAAVRAAVDAGAEVSVVPGPSAVTAAIGSCPAVVANGPSGSPRSRPPTPRWSSSPPAPASSTTSASWRRWPPTARWWSVGS